MCAIIDFALALLSIATAQGGTTAQTDLASITVTPLTHQAGAKADWQTIYDYAGGTPPPGTRLTTEGKWIDPPVRQEPSGVTFAFPNLPDGPENGQRLRIAFAYDRPLANYPTRATIQYTSFFDQSMPQSPWWTPFTLCANHDERPLFEHITASMAKGGAATMPLKLVGDNTLVFSLNGQGDSSMTMNGHDATAFFLKDAAKSLEKMKPGAMLLNGLSINNDITQFPHNKGDWFAVHAFKIEQLRPPLEASSEAAVDLTVPGSEPVRVTIEVVDAKNDSKGYVLYEAMVAPGKYRLYWEGIDQKGMKPEETAWVGAGPYTFRLTTSKTEMRYAGEINNNPPKYTSISYQIDHVFALAMMPPGTAVPQEHGPKWVDRNNPDDTRKIDATDSVQCLSASAVAKGQWIAADGAVINTNTASIMSQHGRAVAITPPDPSDPTNPDKQFVFYSQSWNGGNAISSVAFPSSKGGEGPRPPKTLTSPDWNCTQAGFVPYQIQIGQLPAMLGPQHELFFETAHAPTATKPGLGAQKIPKDQQILQAEWVFRNVRFYEEGQPDPGPTTFDPSKFSVRPDPTFKKTSPSATVPLTTISETIPPTPPKPPKSKPPEPIPPGTVTVEDNGHAVRLNNAPTVNYPFNYTVTPHTIMAFDLDVVDRTKVGKGNGIGLSPDVIASKDDEASHYFDFQGGQAASDPRHGFSDSSIGASPYPTFKPNTLYTDSFPKQPVRGRASNNGKINFLFQPGFYGLKISEDGKFLFACNNADNRLEVRDISTDGHAVAKIPIDYPMFVTLAPEGAAGAPHGTRYVYVDSPNAGLQRIAWNLSGNTFGKPETITPASEFAYPRGLTYSTATGRIFVCDTFNLDRSKVANQIAVIDPNTGKVLSRFGKKGGIDPATGGRIDDETFTCPLTIDADSKGNLWVNDYCTGETRKYDFDPATNGFKLERRAEGPNLGAASHFFWLPDAPPTQAWTLEDDFLVRHEADFDADSLLTNQRATSVIFELTPNLGRCYPHFSKVGDHVYAAFAGTPNIYEHVGDGWTRRFAFGGNNTGEKGEIINAETVARNAGLLAKPGEPPTDLDKAIAASGDPDWATRPWAWSDLNGDGKMEYTADNPEFKIDFNSKLSITHEFPSSCFRSSDGAYVYPINDKQDNKASLLVLPPQMVNGKASYDWKNAKVIPCTDGPAIADILAQDDRFYVLRNRYRAAFDTGSYLECYDESGKLLWTREHINISLQNLQPLGDGMFTIMDRGWGVIGPVMIRTKDGDLVDQTICRDGGDCWASGALRADADTGYIGIVQVFKFTGLSTVKSAAATVNLPRAGL